MVLIPLLTGFLIAALGGTFIIPFLHRIKFGQKVRSQGPKSHYLKSGTPTMGGVIFLLSAAFTTLFFSQRGPEIFLILLATFGFGLIGFVDDFIKVALKRALGLRATHKLLAQILLSTFVCYYGAVKFPDIVNINLPFTNTGFTLGLLFVPFSVIVMIATVNSVNLTDGLDGLLSGISVIVLSGYALICYTQGKPDALIFCLGLIGGLLGFLLFNKHPASVFMGDTGSFAIGGAISCLAVLTKTQLLLPLIGFIFVIEALSVILQVFFYRVFGRKIFRMSPLHHHFELTGLTEPQVVLRFWGVTFVTVLLGLVAFYR